LDTAIITGRHSDMVAIRGAELRIGDIYQGSVDKVEALSELAEKHQLSLAQIAYVGDDLNDLPVMTRVGLACAVANAVAEVQEHAHFITSKHGGQGAVREVIELILNAQDKWQPLVDAYLQGGSHDHRQ